MLAKYVTAAMAGSMLLASAAFAAETTTTTAPGATAGVSDASYQGNWRASKLVGLNVYNEQNESVGSINDLLMDKSGNIKAAVIGVGGFLGMGAHLVAVSFDKIKFSTQPVVYTGASNMAPGAGGGTARPGSTTTTGSAANPANPPVAAAPLKPNPWYPDHAVFNATRDELKNMPEFIYSTE